MNKQTDTFDDFWYDDLDLSRSRRAARLVGIGFASIISISGLFAAASYADSGIETGLAPGIAGAAMFVVPDKQPETVRERKPAEWTTKTDLVAFKAYRRAARNAPCEIEPSLLAGIGSVESGHGTFMPAPNETQTLRKNGNTEHRIIGIPLDGTNNTRVMWDSDGGKLDGDIVYDRAVGPMQFIPETWEANKTDGNNDGKTNPQNIYDATASAATYLCSGSDLTTEAGIRAAVKKYNVPYKYYLKVTAAAQTYRGWGLDNIK